MRKQITEKGRILRQQCVQVKRTFRCHKLVEAYFARVDRGPLFQGQIMRGVRSIIADMLENHKTSIPEEEGFAAAHSVTYVRNSVS